VHSTAAAAASWTSHTAGGMPCAHRSLLCACTHLQPAACSRPVRSTSLRMRHDCAWLYKRITRSLIEHSWGVGSRHGCAHIEPALPAP
jgi:hypothetical protein